LFSPCHATGAIWGAARADALEGRLTVLRRRSASAGFLICEFLSEDERFTTLSYDECTRLGVPVISLQA
jgi:hypothetical protein